MKALLLSLVACFNLSAMDSKIDELKFGDTPKPEWVDTQGLCQEEVLQALYDRATPLSNDVLDAKQIQMVKNKEWEVGRLKNKSLHVDLSNKNRFNAGHYNQVNGENAAQEAIEQLKKAKNNDSADKK